MRKQAEIIDNVRVNVLNAGIDGGIGQIYLNGIKNEPVNVVWSFGGGWEHVSCSYRRRCPTWDEMCKIKDIFFYPEEVAVQYHPRESEYVNVHPFCLHIWRKRGVDFETPPTSFV